MPKLPTQWIRYEAPDGEALAYEAACHVDSDGLFTVALDPRLDATAISLQHKLEHGTEKIQFGLRQSHGKWRIEARRLVDAVAGAKLVAKVFMECTTVTERVICYKMSSDVSFWQLKNGGIVGNGSCAKDGEDGRWWQPKNQHDERHGTNPCRSGFKVGFAAAVFDRTTYTRASGVTYDWDLVDYRDEGAASLLNSFTVLRMDPAHEHDLQVRPYTDEAALYFYDILVGICRMARSLDEFFADKEKLELSIKTRTPLLLKS